MISWSRTLSIYKDFWYTYYKSIGHRQMFLLPADSADRADVVYTETRWQWKVRSLILHGVCMEQFVYEYTTT